MMRSARSCAGCTLSSAPLAAGSSDRKIDSTRCRSTGPSMLVPINATSGTCEAATVRDLRPEIQLLANFQLSVQNYIMRPLLPKYSRVP